MHPYCGTSSSYLGLVQQNGVLYIFGPLGDKANVIILLFGESSPFHRPKNMTLNDPE